MVDKTRGTASMGHAGTIKFIDLSSSEEDEDIDATQQ
jgi:hypothetical protein